MSEGKLSFAMKCKELSEKYTKELSLYSPFPDLKERLSDDSSPFAQKLRSEMIREGEEALSKEYPTIYATDYMRFRREGNRAEFEAKYFEKRHMLNNFVIAELIEGKGRFMDRIIDGIFSICEETSWCLPAHNSYIRDSVQLILADSARPVLDLFACESGAQMSMLLYLIADKLDEISPLITKRIRAELMKRIIEPYLNEHFWWMGRGEEPMCNWTPWCTTNILLTAFVDNGLEISQPDRQAIFQKSAASVDYFLKEYGDDGCCDEGAQYYKHAGLCLYSCLEILNAISNDAFAGLYSEDKIKNMAAYIALVHVDGPWYFNFSDCSPKAGSTGAREYLFGKATGQDFLMGFAAEDYHMAIENGNLLKDESIKLNLYYRSQSIYHYKEITEYSIKSQGTKYTPDVWYESVGLMIARSEHLALAVKAGDNDDSHNHNDTGSITLYKDGQPVLADIGVETYTAKTFSKDRYDIWTMQSGYHNLPVIMGLDQLPGENYRATEIELSGSKSISMHLEQAYPDEISSKYSYVRSVELDADNNMVKLCDKTDAGDVVLNFITYDKPECLKSSDEADHNVVVGDSMDTAGLNIQVGNAQLNITGASLIDIETLPITDNRLKTAWDHDMYRIRLKMQAGLFKMTIA